MNLGRTPFSTQQHACQFFLPPSSLQPCCLSQNVTSSRVSFYLCYLHAQATHFQQVEGNLRYAKDATALHAGPGGKGCRSMCCCVCWSIFLQIFSSKCCMEQLWILRLHWECIGHVEQKHSAHSLYLLLPHIYTVRGGRANLQLGSNSLVFNAASAWIVSGQKQSGPEVIYL